MVRLNSYRYKKAQATLEMTLALMIVLILFFGTIKIFVWFASRIVQRQEDYEEISERVAAGSIQKDESGVYVDESDYPPLDIFGENN